MGGRTVEVEEILREHPAYIQWYVLQKQADITCLETSWTF